MLMLIFSGCSTAVPEYVFFKTEIREQLEERAVDYCHGDFRVVNAPQRKSYEQCDQRAPVQFGGWFTPLTKWEIARRDNKTVSS